jgi:hypothetical protein
VFGDFTFSWWDALERYYKAGIPWLNRRRRA